MEREAWSTEVAEAITNPGPELLGQAGALLVLPRDSKYPIIKDSKTDHIGIMQELYRGYMGLVPKPILRVWLSGPEALNIGYLDPLGFFLV